MANAVKSDEKEIGKLVQEIDDIIIPKPRLEIVTQIDELELCTKTPSIIYEVEMLSENGTSVYKEMVSPKNFENGQTYNIIGLKDKGEINQVKVTQIYNPYELINTSGTEQTVIVNMENEETYETIFSFYADETRTDLINTAITDYKFKKASNGIWSIYNENKVAEDEKISIDKKFINNELNIIPSFNHTIPSYARMRVISNDDLHSVSAENWQIDYDKYYYSELLNSDSSLQEWLEISLNDLMSQSENFNVMIIMETTEALYNEDGSSYADWNRVKELGGPEGGN